MSCLKIKILCFYVKMSILPITLEITVSLLLDKCQCLQDSDNSVSDHPRVDAGYLYCCCCVQP